MAKKINSPAAAKPSVAKATTSEPVSTPVRNTTVPPKSVTVAAPAKKSPPTYDAIALRAFTIWQSSGGNELENWIRAERELSSL